MEESIKCAVATDALHSSLFKHETPYAFSERLLDHVVDDFIAASRKSALEAIRKNSDCADTVPTEYAINERLFILLDALGHMDQSLWNQMATNYIHRFNNRGASMPYFLQSTYAIYIQTVFSRNPDGTRNTVTCDKVVDATRFMVQFLKHIIKQVFVCTTAFTDLRQAIPRLITTQKCIRFALQALTQNVRVTRQIDHAQDPVVLQMESEAHIQQAHTRLESASHADEHADSYSERARDARDARAGDEHRSTAGKTANMDARSDYTTPRQSQVHVQPNARTYPRALSSAPSFAAPVPAAPPSVAPPLVAPPLVAPPSVAPPSVAPPSVAPPLVAPPSVAPASRHVGEAQTPRSTCTRLTGADRSAREHASSPHSAHDRLMQITNGGPPVFQFRFRDPDAVAKPKNPAADTTTGAARAEPDTAPTNALTEEPTHESDDEPMNESTREFSGGTAGMSAFEPTRKNTPEPAAVEPNLRSSSSAVRLDRAVSSVQHKHTTTEPASPPSPPNPPTLGVASVSGRHASPSESVPAGPSKLSVQFEKGASVPPAKTVVPNARNTGGVHKHTNVFRERTSAPSVHSNASAGPARASVASAHTNHHAASTVVIQPSDSISEISADRRAALHHTLCRDNWSEVPRSSVPRVPTAAASRSGARDHVGSARTADRQSSLFLPPIAP